jgi:predicted KAP-like P-loop ATPase
MRLRFRRRDRRDADRPAEVSEAQPDDGLSIERSDADKLRADQPILHATEDRLGRIEFARAIATAVRDSPRRAGFTIGVTGAWGEGKSSVLNLVVRELESTDSAEVLEFNPWLFSGTEQLVGHFFEELTAQFAESRDQRVRRVADGLRIYGRIVAPLRLVPGVGDVVKASIDLTQDLSAALTPEQPSARQQRARLRRTLEKLEKPVVVVVDDIDRLRQEEIVDVMRMVRLVGDFPNLVYVLAFDRPRVEAALSASDERESGRAYLEKIVQVLHDVPPPRPAVLTELIIEDCFDAVGDLTAFHFHQEHFTNVFYGGMRDLFATLRDVNRFTNVLPATLGLIGDEIELADILALEAVRVFAPDAFAAILGGGEALTRPYDVDPGDERDAADRATVVGIVAAADRHQAAVAALIRRLFPAAARHLGGSSFGAASMASWRHERRVAHPEILDVYVRRLLRQQRVLRRLTLPGRDTMLSDIHQ